MPTYVSLAEAASYLDVSKNTLRNWDASGKLKADRNPLNGYRRYKLSSLLDARQALKAGNPPVADEHPAEPAEPLNAPQGSLRQLRLIINRLHGLIRDSGASSDLMERFDDISKLLFVKLAGDAGHPTSVFDCVRQPEDAHLVREAYASLASAHALSGDAADWQLHLSDECLYECSKLIAGLDSLAIDADVKGLAYEEVIRGTFDKNDNQQFFTPTPIVEFMAGMLSDRLEGVVCDPACGTSSFLIAAAKRNPRARFLGFEIDNRLVRTSQMNLVLHGIADGRIRYLSDGGSLGRGIREWFGTVDAILTNPPFGSDLANPALLGDFALGRGRKSRRRGILFIEQAWNLLKPGGVMGIIIDQSILDSSSYRDARQFITSHFRVLAIVDLPESAFMPYASVSTSILFLEKVMEPAARQTVFYAKARHVGRRQNGDEDLVYEADGSYSLNSDLGPILDAWRRHRRGQPLGSRANAYICDFGEERFDNPDTRLDFAFHHPVRLESVRMMGRCKYPLKELGELCDERNEALLPAADASLPSIMFTGLASIESSSGKAMQVSTAAASIKSTVKRYEKDDILFSRMRPNLRKVAMMPFENGGYASNECTVLTVHKDEAGAPVINPRLLSAILRSDFVWGQIMHLVQGSGRPRLSNKNLRRIKIPLIPSDLQALYIAQLESQEKVINQLRANAHTLLDEADELEKDATNSFVNDAFEVSHDS